MYPGLLVLVAIYLIVFTQSFPSLFRFDGRVVAKLPFVPISLLQGLSHRNIRGEDYTDCSFIFFYIICTMSIRQVRQILYCVFYVFDWINSLDGYESTSGSNVDKMILQMVYSPHYLPGVPKYKT